MLPDPLHPAIVHFPLVLAVLLPLFTAGAIWAIRRGAQLRRAWSIPVLAALALAGSAWLAVETGEAQDERVERVVAEAPLSAHEEMAETFLTASTVVTLLAAAGLLGGVVGKIARPATAIASLALVLGALRVGHSGGQLVYRYGAANAYVPGVSASTTAGSGGDDDQRQR
jgi:uncharacterized membrane protein